jgi:hypothetical protein
MSTPCHSRLKPQDQQTKLKIVNRLREPPGLTTRGASWTSLVWLVSLFQPKLPVGAAPAPGPNQHNLDDITLLVPAVQVRRV